MPDTIRVTYATRFGSAQEVAEAIAAVLRKRGLTVESGPIQKERNLDQYGAVVLGTLLDMFHSHQGALRFLAQHGAALAQRPVVIVNTIIPLTHAWRGPCSAPQELIWISNTLTPSASVRSFPSSAFSLARSHELFRKKEAN